MVAGYRKAAQAYKTLHGGPNAAAWATNAAPRWRTEEAYSANPWPLPSSLAAFG